MTSIVNTLLIIAEQALLHMPILLGAYISMSLLKVPDLSLESAYVCGAIAGAQVLRHLSFLPLPLVLLCTVIASLCGGIIVGTVSSSITTRLRIPHLLSSLITIGLFHGINQLALGAYLSLSDKPNPLALISALPYNPEFPVVLIIGIVTLILIALFLHTQLGYACTVYGNNPRFFEQYGISTSYIFTVGILLSNALAGLSGYLFAQSNGFVELGMGVGKPLMCISALMLGKALVASKKPSSIFVPLVGCIAYFVISQLLLKAGFNLKYFTAVQAALILLILAIHYRKTGINATNNLGL
jgi:putative ABC transport system permease protein